MTAPDLAGLSRDDAVAQLRRHFEEAGLATPGLDARLLAAHALGLTAAGLLATTRERLEAAEARRLTGLAVRRLAREPVARILGEQEFWSLPFRLSPETLTPRPDSETVVEAALAALPERDAPLQILDLGTGSGCLLVALLHERPRAWGLGLDRSPACLATARHNAAANGVGAQAAFLAADWGAAIGGGRFDLVVSNPPYIRHGEIAGLAPEVAAHDPMLALDGGPDGLDAYRAIAAHLPALLAAGGVAVLEVGHDQAEDVAALGRDQGLRVVAIRPDLAGHARAVVLGAAPAAARPASP